ncbi:small ribosomal subunit Rsm22 family protein [Streptomyces sp. NPDC051940]|uniref:small ribosomal subunit Rsm22 family protein n=1 Tax=Streptomyces sp. NPDC051940 TaxID=3155675 RepID=UPI00341995A9
MSETEDALRRTLAGALDGLPARQAAQAVDRLIENYRGATPTAAPVLRNAADVAAYAAYRMPATFESVRAALGALRTAAGDWAPASHVDIGGGTGAATWAVADAWPAERDTVVIDWAEPALELGKQLAAGSGLPALAGVEWRRQVVGTGLELPDTDLVTVSYVLGELTGPDRAAVVDAAADAAQAVVVVEPGTPDGYRRVIEARGRLIEAGFTVAAPCPHDGTCPIMAAANPAEPAVDWCHFAARVQRSSLHRKVKGGALGHEDEKFSYVAAVRFPVRPAANRVVRHPQIRKGLVMLRLCTAEDGLAGENVSKRHGPLYRAARDVEWGDAWPPGDLTL